jgi:hypothetical protein
MCSLVGFRAGGLCIGTRPVVDGIMVAVGYLGAFAMMVPRAVFLSTDI